VIGQQSTPSKTIHAPGPQPIDLWHDAELGGENHTLFRQANMSRCWSCWLASVFISALIVSSLGRITHTSIENDDRRTITLSRPFGFTTFGHLQLQISNPKLPQNGEQSSSLRCFAFYLVQASVTFLQTEDEEGRCSPVEANPSHSVLKVTDFGEREFTKLLERNGDEDKEHQPVPIDYEPHQSISGLHTLYFVNCCNEDKQVAVSFDIRTEMWNTVGGAKSYLSVGEIELPNMYLVRCLVPLLHTSMASHQLPNEWVVLQAMCILFTIGLVMWVYHVMTNRSAAHRIHYLMIGLGVFKVLTLLAQMGMYHYIRITGQPDGWNVAYYIFTFFRSVLLFTVIILISTGWSYMTPFLGDKERRVLLVVLPLQVRLVLALCFGEFQSTSHCVTALSPEQNHASEAFMHESGRSKQADNCNAGFPGREVQPQ
jgi:G protein-coupled receptor 107